MSDGTLAFVALIFIAVFLLTQGLVVPVFGESRKMRKKLRGRLREIESSSGEEVLSSLLREKYLRSLSPTEKWLESLPTMEWLGAMLEQAGYKTLAYRLVLVCLITGGVAAYFFWRATRMPTVALISLLLFAAIPLFKVLHDRRKRMQKFEEQLPDAIDVMKRALQAGHPFSAALQLVAEDMDEPIGKEFELAFADINYGNDVRRAMLGLLQRVPSVTVMALVTSVLIQKETGGNLAEILEQIGKVIRGRFKLQRRVKTLSAEGRLSAWILLLTPLVLFAVVSVTTPTYLPVLLEDPTGRKMIAVAISLGVVGVFWIKKIIRIEV
ncbi:MAG: type II secretion system F family protein [Woeseiaceae bacterium]|nr:type II secretion system F family protein [Woeseiaceae bacterium]